MGTINQGMVTKMELRDLRVAQEARQVEQVTIKRERSPQGVHWVVVADYIGGFRSYLDTKRGDTREFVSLDSVWKTLESAGVRGAVIQA